MLRFFFRPGLQPESPSCQRWHLARRRPSGGPPRTEHREQSLTQCTNALSTHTKINLALSSVPLWIAWSSGDLPNFATMIFTGYPRGSTHRDPIDEILDGSLNKYTFWSRIVFGFWPRRQDLRDHGSYVALVREGCCVPPWTNSSSFPMKRLGS